MAIWTVTVLPENVSEGFKDAYGVKYVLTDGSTLPVRVEPVWCGGCRHVTNGERIETVDVLDRMAAYWRDPPSIHCDPLNEPDLARWAVVRGSDQRLVNVDPRADLDRRRAWLLARRSPPRCLQCRSIAIVPFPPSDGIAEMSHPRGPGHLRLHSPRTADYWGDWPPWLTP